MLEAWTPETALELHSLNLQKRLRLVTTRGVQAYAEVNADPAAVVDDLVRCALVYTIARRLSRMLPNEPFEGLVRRAEYEADALTVGFP